MTTHKLKTWCEYFQATKRGEKLFEFRVNDRDYQEGDTLCLQEYDPHTKTYTGEELTVKVTLVLTTLSFCAIDTHVLMGIEHPGQTVLREVLQENFYDNQQKGYLYNKNACETKIDKETFIDTKVTSAQLFSLLQLCGEPTHQITSLVECNDCHYAKNCWVEEYEEDTDSPTCQACLKPTMSNFKKRYEASPEDIQRVIIEILTSLGDANGIEWVSLLDILQDHEPRLPDSTFKTCLKMLWEEGQIYTLPSSMCLIIGPLFLYRPPLLLQESTESMVRDFILEFVKERGYLVVEQVWTEVQTKIKNCEDLHVDYKFVKYMCGNLRKEGHIAGL